MKNLIALILCLVIIGAVGKIEFPPSLYDKANQVALSQTGCGISDIKEAIRTEKGYKVVAISACDRSEFIIIIEE